MNVFVYPRSPTASSTPASYAPYGGRQYGAGSRPVAALRIAAAAGM